jgi:DNA polymerase sigma
MEKDLFRKILRWVAEGINLRGGKRYHVMDVLTYKKMNVPIIKLTASPDKQHTFAIDIAINQYHGIAQNDENEKILAMYPEIRPLFLLLKQMQKTRKLKVGTRGLTSFVLFCLLHTFFHLCVPKLRIQSVQSSQKNEYNTSIQHRLDQLLVEFLNFLHQFDETKYKIVIYGHKDGGPKIARKSKLEPQEGLRVQVPFHESRRNIAQNLSVNLFANIKRFSACCLHFCSKATISTKCFLDTEKYPYTFPEP